MATTKATTLAHTLASTTSSTADLNYAKTLNDTGVTSTEFDKLDGLTATTDELNLVDGSVSGPLSHRNVIINGGMQVWQRRPSYSGTVDVSNNSNEDYNSVDRWKPTFGNSCGGGVSWSRSTEVPDIAGGDYFYDSLKVQTYSTTTPNTSKHATIDYRVEAHDMQRFGWGKTNKKDAVLSFYFKTSKTGIYSWYFRTPTGPRHRMISFTVSDTNWNRYSIALTADTVAIPDANTEGLQIRLNLINSPDNDYTSGTDSGWGTTEYFNDDGQVNFLDSASNILYLTGVQLELGSVATPFEHRSYADEFQRCLRYYEKWKRDGNDTDTEIMSIGFGMWYSPSQILGHMEFAQKRAEPTITVSSADWARIYKYQGGEDSNDSSSPVDLATRKSARFNITTGGSANVNGGGAHIILSSNNSEYIEIKAEL